MAVVLSTISGRPALSEIDDMALRSVIYPPGFAIDSQKTARVLSSIAFSSAFKSSKSTNFADQPKRLIVWLNWVTVPPYKRVEAITLHQGDIRGNKAIIWAA